jgi:hypothetical protein
MTERNVDAHTTYFANYYTRPSKEGRIWDWMAETPREIEIPKDNWRNDIREWFVDRRAPGFVDRESDDLVAEIERSAMAYLTEDQRRERQQGNRRV